jgi:acyl dehydratase
MISPNKDDRWFEDYAVGNVYELGPVIVEEAEILDFGRRYDPQPFHTDPNIGAASPYGGLIVSGWHTCALMMRMLVEGLISRKSGLGSPGMEQIRWLKPVRPGDALRCRVEVTSARRSQSRPDRGIIAMDIAVTNQTGETVMTAKGWGIYRVRPRDEGGEPNRA